MAFNVPINSIAPLPTPTDWVRPADWIVITDTPNEVQFLVCDTGSKSFSIVTTFIQNSGTNIYIDWGDGVVDTVSTIAQTTTSHTYSTGGTPCSRGYNTWKIRVYGDATCVITNALPKQNFSVTGGSSFHNLGLLEAYFGDNTCNTTAFLSGYFYSNTTNIGYTSFQLLEYIKLPITVTWNTSMTNMFNGCTNLYKVVMPTSASALTNLTSTFQGCTNLLDVALPSNSTLISTLSNTFGTCINLRTISFPSTLNVCTSFNGTFTNCRSLKNLTIPSIDKVIDFGNGFQNCYSLQWIKFNSLPSPISTNTAVVMVGAFQNCYSLQNVYFPNTCSSNAVYSCTSMFGNCYNLKNLLFPIGFDSSTFASTWSFCYSLTSVTFQSACPNLTVFSSSFSNCTLLKSITLPSTVGSSISLVSLFQTCVSLESITIPSGWSVSSFSGTFSNCESLSSIVLPNNAQDACTTMQNMCNGCVKLKSIVMPTSLNGLLSLVSAFSACYELTSVTLPSSLTAVTNIQSAFNACYNLLSITLPTSMPNCSGFSNAFTNCYSLTSITLPSTISASTTSFASLVSGCVSLQTLTLPTTQTSLVTSIASMFSTCGNLTTINNLGKVGSLTATPLVDGTLAPSYFYTNMLTSLSFNCPFTLLRLQGNSTTQNFNKLNSLRLLNSGAGQYTGVSPQINVSFCDLGIAALNQLFTDLPTVVGKTINITSCTGAAGCTRTIATLKGWTVTG